MYEHIVASELKDPICHSNECQIGSFSSEATIYKETICYSIVIKTTVNIIMLLLILVEKETFTSSTMHMMDLLTRINLENITWVNNRTTGNVFLHIITDTESSN